MRSEAPSVSQLMQRSVEELEILLAGLTDEYHETGDEYYARFAERVDQVLDKKRAAHE